MDIKKWADNLLFCSHNWEDNHGAQKRRTYTLRTYKVRSYPDQKATHLLFCSHDHIMAHTRRHSSNTIKEMVCICRPGQL